MDPLQQPIPEAMLYEDKKLYVCLASFPITKGHTIVVWKNPVPDLNMLERKDYEYLMNAVDAMRGVLLKALHVEKVYLLYMDETMHVHWHLVPRFNEEGFNVFTHEPKEIHDFSLAESVKRELKNAI